MKIALIESYPNKKINYNKQIDVHLRNSISISKYLQADLLCEESDFLKAVKKEYDVLILGYATRYSPFHLIRQLIEKNKSAKKFAISNEYNSVSIVGGFAPYELIMNYEKAEGGESVLKTHFVNLNLLMSNKANRIIEKKYDCVYYGTFRPNRVKYFKIYLRDEIYLSTSKKNLKKFKHIGCSPRYINKLSFIRGFETLNLFKYSLYIEDEYTHLIFNNLANRWYEAGICNVVMFFDINCRNTVERSEIFHFISQIEYYFVKDYVDLQNKIKELKMLREDHDEITERDNYE